MGPLVTLKSLVSATPNQVSTDLAGKTAILHLQNRNYYTFDKVATAIWEQLQQERTVEEISQTLAPRYDVDPTRYEQDLIQFLQKLADQNLIRVR